MELKKRYEPGCNHFPSPPFGFAPGYSYRQFTAGNWSVRRLTKDQPIKIKKEIVRAARLLRRAEQAGAPLHLRAKVLDDRIVIWRPTHSPLRVSQRDYDALLNLERQGFRVVVGNSETGAFAEPLASLVVE